MKKTRVILPQLKKEMNKDARYKYKLDAPELTRKRALNESIKFISKKTGKSLREAAVEKKARLNILRIYRRNKNPQEARLITQDMKWLSDRYKLGETKRITKSKK